MRIEARLDPLDVAASLLLFGCVLLSLAVAESWFWLTIVGFALVAAVYTVKGVHWVRARRRSTA